MSSRSSSRRLTAEPPGGGRASRSRLSTTVNVQDVEPEEPETEAEEDDSDADLTPEPGSSRPTSRRGRGGARARGRQRGGRGGRGSRERTRTGTADEDAEEGGKSLRLRKNVSYAELKAAEDEEEEEEEEEVEEIEAADAQQVTPGTPRARARTSEQPQASPSTRGIEKIGSGRGGFSVKGAASAAARARWAKYRSEKADDSDDGPKIKRSGGAANAARKDNRAAADKLPEGSVIEIKGKEYTVGDDEVILDDDEKGDTKVDALGNLLGDREYRLVTFNSDSRKDPKKLYALTIDAARACGYQDSLAFLRRFPQILKLACSSEERQMLIDIGRVTGNLKNRMVTMVSMRNVFKVMGARVVKDGKWVTDDYYEDKAMADCAENGFTPFATVHEDEIFSNAMASMAPQRPAAGGRDSDAVVPRAVLSLAPTYTLGGATTHFASGGVDPWSEAGWGNKRQKLKSLGVTEEDWIYRTALESRMVDEQLKEYREDRLGRLEGADLKGWVWTLQKVADGLIEEAGKGTESGVAKDEREPTAEWLKPPMPERKRSGLSQEVRAEEGGDVQVEEPISGAGEGDVEMGETDAEGEKAGPDIVVQTEEEAMRDRASRTWSKGSWEPGVVRAIIEPHTHIPHVPLHTQPHSSSFTRLSHSPLLASLPDQSYQHRIQSSLSRSAARGLASVEFVFEPAGGNGEHDERMRMVRDAEEWERQMRAGKPAIV